MNTLNNRFNNKTNKTRRNQAIMYNNNMSSCFHVASVHSYLFKSNVENNSLSNVWFWIQVSFTAALKCQWQSGTDKCLKIKFKPKLCHLTYKIYVWLHLSGLIKLIPASFMTVIPYHRHHILRIPTWIMLNKWWQL